MTRRAPLPGLAVLAGALSIAGMARATPYPQCSTVASQTMTTPLYIAGSDAAMPLVAQLAQEFNKEAMASPPVVEPTTIFYQPSGSCVGVNALLTDPGAMVQSCAGAPCLTGLAYYFPAQDSTTPSLCELDTMGDHDDLVLSDTDVTACGAGPMLPSSFIDTLGPVVTMEFVTRNNTVQSITDKQAYFTFGFSCGGEVQPWTDGSLRFVREPTSGIATVLEPLIGLPSNAIHGNFPSDFSTQKMSGSEWVLASLVGVDPSKTTATIGWLPSSVADAQRTGGAGAALFPLAFQAAGQHGGYYPDSALTTFDKQNVRDGHYPAFGYLHMITRRGQNGLPMPLNAKFFTDVVTGTKSFSDGFFDIFTTIASDHFVPQCAMTVQRKNDEFGADGYTVVPYEDPQPCGCAFDVASNPQHVAPASCVACKGPADCQIGPNYFCRMGYCEAR